MDGDTPLDGQTAAASASARPRTASDGIGPSHAAAALAALRDVGSSWGSRGLVDSVPTAVSSPDAVQPVDAEGAIRAAMGSSYSAFRDRSSPSLVEWREALRRALGGASEAKPRRNRTPSDFLEPLEAEVGSLRELLKVISVMQQKNSGLALVWRGHQRAGWPVDSSLTRSLRAAGHDLGETQMNAVELFQMGAADRWGLAHGNGELNFLAELQHEGVPTRLIDVSLDPEVAAWFAVQESSDHDGSDGRLIAWGRTAAVKKTHVKQQPPSVPPAGGDAFWHRWPDQATRVENEWGTGRSILSWQPAALNERMRAQRAAFLFDAEPSLDAALLDLFAERLGQSWRVDEIARSTRVLGLPSRHDIRARPNDARVVPMFSVRIEAGAKPAIREYLQSKGLTESTIYPDRGGLLQYLRRTSSELVPEANQVSQGRMLST